MGVHYLPLPTPLLHPLTHILYAKWDETFVKSLMAFLWCEPNAHAAVGWKIPGSNFLSRWLGSCQKALRALSDTDTQSFFSVMETELGNDSVPLTSTSTSTVKVLLVHIVFSEFRSLFLFPIPSVFFIITIIRLSNRMHSSVIPLAVSLFGWRNRSFALPRTSGVCLLAVLVWFLLLFFGSFPFFTFQWNSHVVVSRPCIFFFLSIYF